MKTTQNWTSALTLLPGVLLAVLQSGTNPFANVYIVGGFFVTCRCHRLLGGVQSSLLIWKGCDCLCTKPAARPGRSFSFILSFWPHRVIMMKYSFAIQIPFFLLNRPPRNRPKSCRNITLSTTEISPTNTEKYTYLRNATINLSWFRLGWPQSRTKTYTHSK